MASINGVTLKNIKHTIGREGYGLIANIYYHGKKVGEFADYADGAMGNCCFDDVEIEHQVIIEAFRYGKNHEIEALTEYYKENPSRYEEEVKRVKEYMPYVPDEEITLNSIAYASEGLDIFVSDISMLIDKEKYFKKMKKQGYYAVATKATNHEEMAAFPPNYTIEKIKESGYDNICTSLTDFDVVTF